MWLAAVGVVDEEQAEPTQHIGELFYCTVRVVSSLFRRTSGMQPRPLRREGGMLDRQIRRAQVGASECRAHVTRARRVQAGAQGSSGASSVRREHPRLRPDTAHSGASIVPSVSEAEGF